MSVEELDRMLAQHHADLYHYRRDLVFRKVTDTAAVKSRRHDIARIKGVMAEMQGGGAPVAVKEKPAAKAAAPKPAAKKVAAKKAPPVKAVKEKAVKEKAAPKEKAPAKKAASKKGEVKA